MTEAPQDLTEQEELFVCAVVSMTALLSKEAS